MPLWPLAALLIAVGFAGLILPAVPDIPLVHVIRVIHERGFRVGC